MSREELKITDWDKCRSRIEHEDNLLNNRASLFLVVNGLGAVAVGLTSDKQSDIVMVIVILIANVLWLIGSSQSANVLKNLTTTYMENANDPIDQLVRDSMKVWPRWIRNTSILGIYIPLLISLGWGVGLIMILLSSSGAS